MEIEGFIFDLDGVIVDTAKYHFTAWRRLANELGIDFTEKENELLKGVSRKQSLEVILGFGDVQLSQEEKDKRLHLKNEWYLELISNIDASEILPGASDLLVHLKENSLRIALGSASSNAVKILNKIGLIDYFETIIDGTKTTKSKPDPQVFQLAANDLGLAPKQCIVFEDSVKGIQAAQTGGFFDIGIGSAENLPEASYCYPSLAEINFIELNRLFEIKK